MIKFLTAAVVTFVLGACSDSTQSQQPRLSGTPGQLRGLSLVNQHLRSKMLDPSDPQTSRFDVRGVAGANLASLSSVLGSYGTGSPRDRISALEVNGFNFLVWHVVMHKVAEAVAGRCVDGLAQFSQSVSLMANRPPVHLNPQLRAPLSQLCESQARDAAFGAALLNFWRILVGYGYPQEESAWVQFWLTTTSTGTELIEQLTRSALLHPYVLLHH